MTDRWKTILVKVKTAQEKEYTSKERQRNRTKVRFLSLFNHCAAVNKEKAF
jgi:hypothetical protein